MSLATVLALLVAFVAAPLNWYVAFRLVRLSRSKPSLWVLRERALTAVALALIVTIFALVFLNNDLPIPVLNLDSTKPLTRGIVLIFSVPPAVYWLWQYRKA